MAARQKSRAKTVREDIRTRLEEQSFLFRGVFVGEKKKTTSAQIGLIFFSFFSLRNRTMRRDFPSRPSKFRREHKCEVILGDAMTKEV